MKERGVQYEPGEASGQSASGSVILTAALDKSMAGGLLRWTECHAITAINLAYLARHRVLRRMAGLVFLLVFWVLAGACQRHDVGWIFSVTHHHHHQGI